MGNQLFAVWKGKNDPAIYWSMTNAGDGSWRPQQVIANVATSSGLAATVYRSSSGVLAAWRGLGDDSCIWTATYDNGWAAQQRPTGAPRTEDRPALAMFGGRAVMAWRGAENDQTIWFSQRNSNATWEAQAPVPGATSACGPALAEFKGKLYMAWRGPEGDEQLRWSQFDGTTWTTPTLFKGASSHSPALVATKLEMSMAWKGAGTDSLLWRARYAGSWSVQTPAVGHSTHGPSLCIISNSAGATDTGSPLMLWKGMGADVTMWSSRLWRPQVSVANGAFGTNNSPAVVSVSHFTY